MVDFNLELLSKGFQRADTTIDKIVEEGDRALAYNRVGDHPSETVQAYINRESGQRSGDCYISSLINASLTDGTKFGPARIYENMNVQDFCSANGEYTHNAPQHYFTILGTGQNAELVDNTLEQFVNNNGQRNLHPQLRKAEPIQALQKQETPPKSSTGFSIKRVKTGKPQELLPIEKFPIVQQLIQNGHVPATPETIAQYVSFLSGNPNPEAVTDIVFNKITSANNPNPFENIPFKTFETTADDRARWNISESITQSQQKANSVIEDAWNKKK